MARIHDYAILGDGRSVALVSREGSVDWLCWPRFDSPPVFGALLDAELGGSFRVRPTAAARVARRYVEHTNVLETAYEMDGGRCVVTDVMTVASEHDKARMFVPDHELLRVVRCERGEVEIEVEVAPRPSFGRVRVRAEHHRTLGIRWLFDRSVLALRAELPLELSPEGVARGVVRLRVGESIAVSLAYDAEGPALLPPLGDAARERVERSARWWREWSSRARYEGEYREQVIRSALAIKLLGFAPSGAIVAAATTSLPERLGGDLNWDYRFCWLRDAAFTVRALLGLGYVEEAEAFCSWLLHTTRLTQPELRVLYDVYGRTPRRERTLPFLRGYGDSRPVRIGNAAVTQLQLDCYGEVIDATTQVLGVIGHADRDTRRLLREFSEYVRRHWRLPDAGIWEPREAPEHRTHSRVLCWVALDRLAELGRTGLVDKVDVAGLAGECAAIRADIEAHGFDAALGAYTGSLGGTELDASVILMPWYRFQPASAVRMRSTFARVCERLGAGRGLLYRYERSRRDGEGAFWVCSYWAADYLARGGGTLAQARAMFAAATSYANDVGLMAEEVDPATGQALGNFPQAYTHVGLITAAVALAERERGQAVVERAVARGAEEVRR